MKGRECNRPCARSNIGNTQIVRPVFRACTQEIHRTLHEHLRIRTRNQRIARAAEVESHKLTPPEHVGERHTCRPLLHRDAELRELCRLKRLVKMHIEIHPILAQHSREQNLCIEARILDVMLPKEVCRPCEETCNRPNSIRHQFTRFSRSA